MPSSLTITAQYNFEPYTKARAVQLNTNFGNLRGHMLPIDPNTISASDQTYDLGVTGYRWNTAYLGSVSLSMSIGAAHALSGTTAGGFKFVKNSLTTFEMNNTYFKGHNATPVGPTTSAAKGQWAHSLPINGTLSTGFLVGSTCTLAHNGRPICVGLKASGDTSASSGIYMYSPYTSTVKMPNFCNIIFLEDGATLGGAQLNLFNRLSAFSSTSNVTGSWPAGSMTKIYPPAGGPGTINLSLEVSITTTGQNFSWIAENLRLFAFELP